MIAVRDRRDGWVGLSSRPRTIRSEPKVGNAQTFYESEMALFYECMPWCAQKKLDAADIVRDGDLTPTMQRGSICPTIMSAIASFIKLPKSALEGLRKASTGGTDRNYLSTNGREVAEYRWSGDVLATLLPYLEEKHQIDLMKSEYGELAAFLTNTAGNDALYLHPGSTHRVFKST